MRNDRSTIRTRSASSASLATTAGALMALVAVAAMMSAGPALRTPILESRVAPVESQSVRAVAAAVAAAAREMIASERLVPDATTTVPPFLDLSLNSIALIEIRNPSDHLNSLLGLIGERLLGLPPPLC